MNQAVVVNVETIQEAPTRAEDAPPPVDLPDINREIVKTREERTTAGSSDRDTSRSSDGAQIGVAVDDDAPPPHVVRDADGVVAAAPASAAVANAPALLRRPTSLLLQRKSSSKYGKLVEDEEQEVSPQPGRFSTGANDDVS